MIWQTPDSQVAIYHAPKNASRTLLGWLACLRDPGLDQRKPEWFEPARHASSGEYHELRVRADVFDPTHDWYPHCGVPCAPHPHRICVVRDPVDRFLSGYTNRVLFHGNLGAKPPGIEEFIENLEHYRANNVVVRGHFLPQCAFLGKEPGLFTHVFRMNALEECRNWLETAQKVVLPKLRLQQSLGVSKPHLSKAVVTRIIDIYYEDYESWADYF
jgi:hypothetical protein